MTQIQLAKSINDYLRDYEKFSRMKFYWSGPDCDRIFVIDYTSPPCTIFISKELKVQVFNLDYKHLEDILPKLQTLSIFI